MSGRGNLPDVMLVPWCTHSRQSLERPTGTIRSELRVAAHRCVDLARARVDCRLDAVPIPVDTPVGLYLGNVRQRTVPATKIRAGSQWNMCAPGYGKSCPTSPLDTIATMRGKPVLCFRLPGACLARFAVNRQASVARMSWSCTPPGHGRARATSLSNSG